MKNIRKSTKTIRGVKVNTLKKIIENFNILEVEVGTTGFCGGDTMGGGGRTYFSIKDLASTDITVDILNDKFHSEAAGVAIKFGGDSELETFIEALEFAVKELKDKI